MADNRLVKSLCKFMFVLILLAFTSRSVNFHMGGCVDIFNEKTLSFNDSTTVCINLTTPMEVQANRVDLFKLYSSESHSQIHFSNLTNRTYLYPGVYVIDVSTKGGQLNLEFKKSIISYIMLIISTHPMELFILLIIVVVAVLFSSMGKPKYYVELATKKPRIGSRVVLLITESNKPCFTSVKVFTNGILYSIGHTDRKGRFFFIPYYKGIYKIYLPKSKQAVFEFRV